MNEVLKTAVSLSLSGSLLILVLLLGKPLYRNRLSRRWQYYIWLVAVARLLLPFTPEVSLMGTLFRQTEQAAVQTETMDVSFPGEPSAAPVQSGMNTGVSRPEPEAEPEDDALSAFCAAAVENLWAVWLGAAALLLIRNITVYQSFAQYIRAGREEVSDLDRLDRLAQIGEQMGVKRPVELYVHPLVSSPLLLGFFRPCIVLPAAELSDAEFAYTVRHELTHYRRRDMCYKWLVRLTVCLHWFNPLVWLMCREVGRACELSCDEAVVKALDPAERRAYGDTLLRAIGAGGRYKSSLASVTLTESAQLLKERLGAIMNIRKTSKLLTALSAVLAMLLLAGGAAAGAYAGTWRESGPVPEALKGDGVYDYFYTQDGYYQAPYLFELGWNVAETAKDSCTSTELSLPDGSAMTVYFHDSSADCLKDAAALDALAELLGTLKGEAEQNRTPLVRPLVVSVKQTGTSVSLSLAEGYYEENELPQFGAVFPELDEAEQEALLTRICGDRNAAFLSVALKRLGTDSALVEYVAEQAYQDGDFASFSIAAQHLSRDALLRWAERAAEDGSAGFLSILYPALGRDGDLENLEEDLKNVEAELNRIKAEDDAERLRDYEAHGITKNGTAFYYRDQKVRVLLDTRADSSLVYLETRPDGTVGVHISRDRDGNIVSVEQMTGEEMTELLGDMAEPDDWDADWDDDWDADWDGDWDADSWFDFLTDEPLDGGNAVTVPVDIETLKDGEVVWLGAFELSDGDRFRYDVSSDTTVPQRGKGIEIGFARSEDEPIEVRYWAVTGGTCEANLVFSGPYAKPGEYHLFIRAAGADLEHVTGSVRLLLQAEQD